jgi:hypothetical protein
MCPMATSTNAPGVIGDPAKLGRDCEIHQHKHLIYSFIICYIRMIVFVGIIQILMFYKVISFSHRLPDVNSAVYDIILWLSPIHSRQ